VVGLKGAPALRLHLRAHHSELDSPSSNPLPAVRVGTKLLVRRSGFDRWLENHKVQAVDVGAMVDEILAGVAGPN
jgi:hypothetical protein